MLLQNWSKAFTNLIEQEESQCLKVSIKDLSWKNFIFIVKTLQQNMEKNPRRTTINEHMRLVILLKLMGNSGFVHFNFNNFCFLEHWLLHLIYFKTYT